MFPIPWNFPLRKKNGNLVNIGDAIDEGTELPEHGEGDAGKVLSVDENGELEWSDEVNSEIQTLTNNVDVLTKNGAVNLLPNSATTDTINGVTFTVNNDGTVTADGEATADANLILSESFYVGSGKAIRMTGCPSDGSSTTYFLRLTAENSTTSKANDTGDGADYTTTENYYGARIVIRGGTTVSNLTFKPMIADAKFSGDYVPYAKTNRELTEDTITQTDVTFTPDTTKATVVNADLYREGKHIRGRLDLKIVNTAGGALGTFNKASAYITPMYAFVGDRTTIDNQPANSYINEQSLVVNPVNAFVVNDRIQLAIDFYTA